MPHDPGVGMRFLDMTQRAQTTKAKLHMILYQVQQRNNSPHILRRTIWQLCTRQRTSVGTNTAGPPMGISTVLGLQDTTVPVFFIFLVFTWVLGLKLGCSCLPGMYFIDWDFSTSSMILLTAFLYSYSVLFIAQLQNPLHV